MVQSEPTIRRGLAYEVNPVTLKSPISSVTVYTANHSNGLKHHRSRSFRYSFGYKADLLKTMDIEDGLVCLNAMFRG